MYVIQSRTPQHEGLCYTILYSHHDVIAHQICPPKGTILSNTIDDKSHLLRTRSARGIYVNRQIREGSNHPEVGQCQFTSLQQNGQQFGPDKTKPTKSHLVCDTPNQRLN